jgi:hypothetical protein
MGSHNGQPSIGHNGVGPLREVLNRAVAESGYNMRELTVLAPQRDPYRLDTSAGHRDAEWFWKQVERFVPNSNDQIHLRGLHYKVSSAADVLLPNGLPYINTDDNWEWVIERPATGARYLGYVAFERIVDERNAPPFIHVPESVSSDPVWEAGEGIWVPGYPIVPRMPCQDRLANSRHGNPIGLSNSGKR